MSILMAMRKCCSRRGSFVGQHVSHAVQGVAVHVNAFNFPVWGMLEKLARRFCRHAGDRQAGDGDRLSGRGRLQDDHRIRLFPTGRCSSSPAGLAHFLTGSGRRIAVSFTGSAATGVMLRGTPNLLERSVRFSAEQDLLNATILGPDIVVGDPEFDLFIRRPPARSPPRPGRNAPRYGASWFAALRRPVAEALSAALGDVAVGDPRLKEVGMGALASGGQKQDVLAKCEMFKGEARCIIGGTPPRLTGEDLAGGAFVAPTIFDCADPDGATHLHEQEAFGPVACSDALSRPCMRPSWRTGAGRLSPRS